MEESVRKETRLKFDILLKDALKKRGTSKSKESLISDKSSNVDEEENLTCEVSVDVHDNKSYILDKFLNDTKLHKNDDSSPETTTIKAPIPKPRRKKNRLVSKETYNPKERKDIDADSDRTYSIEIMPNNNDPIDMYKSLSNKQYDSDADINTKSNSTPSRTSTTLDKIAYENEIHEKERQNKIKGEENVDDQNELDSEITSNKHSYKEIMAITIHRTDFLELQSIVIHPIIKIHLINGNTGEYLRKSDDNRSVILHYDDKKISYISPVLTQSFDLQKKRYAN